MSRTREEDIPTPYRRRLGNTRGQVAVEYILLLAIGVIIASIITKGVVSREAGGKPGFLIGKWSDIITLIGADNIDDP